MILHRDALPCSCRSVASNPASASRVFTQGGILPPLLANVALSVPEESTSGFVLTAQSWS